MQGIHACKVGAVEELVAEVRREKIASCSACQSSQHEVMNLINALQRLGESYHFEGEIQEDLNIYMLPCIFMETLMMIFTMSPFVFDCSVNKDFVFHAVC